MAREERARKSGLGVVDDELMERYKKDQESAKAKSGSGQSAEWISLKDGLNMVRLLPPLTKGDPFYIYIGQHFQLGETKKGNVYCPRLCLSMDGKTLMSDEACPICEYVAEVKKLSKKTSEVAAADEMRVSGRWLCQALDVDEDDGKPRFWSMGPMIYNQIMEYLTGKYPMLYQLDGGYDLNVKKSGKGLETKYQLYPEKDSTEVDERVVDDMLDLEEYVRVRLFSRDELNRVLDGEDPMEIVNGRSSEEKDARKTGREPEETPVRGRSRKEPEPEEEPPVRARGRREPEPEEAPARGRGGRGDEYDDAAEKEMARLRDKSSGKSTRREPEPEPEPRGRSRR
jgi:hypothetical protein